MNPKALALALLLAAGGASAAILTGPAAWGDWTSDAPGVTRKITLESLPAPGLGAFNYLFGGGPPELVRRPAGARLAVPPGFTVSAFASLDAPRQLRTAPNG